MVVCDAKGNDCMNRQYKRERRTLDAAYWLSLNTQSWLLWIAGGALILGSWLHWLTTRAGWVGLALAMVGVRGRRTKRHGAGSSRLAL